jgi:hypothetical protein
MEILKVLVLVWLAISAAVPSRQVRVSKACLDAPLAPGCMP